MKTDELSDVVLSALRRIVRAIDIQSRQLVRQHGLTGPQIIILKTLMQMQRTTISQLAERVSLSKPTVTDILNRLERQNLVTRIRSTDDKRCVYVEATQAAHDKLDASIPLMQEAFCKQFNVLKHWEQYQIISSLERIAVMMNARDLDAAPYLSGDPMQIPDSVTEIRSVDQNKERISSNSKPGQKSNEC